MFNRSFLVVLSLQILQNGGNEIGSQSKTRKIRQSHICSIPSTDEYGVCQRWSSCQSAQTAYYSRGIAPIYCEYDRFDPIVCCPMTSEKVREERISVKMCRETFMPKPMDETCGPSTSSTEATNPETTTLKFFCILVGEPAGPQEFTHMVALGWKKTDKLYDFLCGGTLISKLFILTAAHCASVRGIAPDIARMGGGNLETSSYDRKIVSIFVHPDYTRKTVYNDIAIMKIDIGTLNKPACLWQTQDINYTQAVAIGYGHTTYAGKSSSDLLKINLNVYPNELCSRYFQTGYKLENGIVDSQICAGDPEKIRDTCQGDSGGPLMVKINDSGKVIPHILGVTSFGQGCAGGPPSIYVRVSSYLDWIESIVWPS